MRPVRELECSMRKPRARTLERGAHEKGHSMAEPRQKQGHPAWLPRARNAACRLHMPGPARAERRAQQWLLARTFNGDVCDCHWHQNIWSAELNPAWLYHDETPGDATRECERSVAQLPMNHISTPRTSNFLPSSLSGSFPNVGHESLIPFASPSSSQRP